ncbi:Fpg/Nei family DNA glycosylase [Jiangella asiatica]|uniref:Fpg/Nei family DNA glycosylase n=1 Tax=Jiangella asiatica TaxID=2530372 RepID=A0A4R5C8Q9_9ACTN|nr:DNA-formamidopyrimidine glycosylase family protein [Jiangella asiatica]TDD95169.1 Fpg/Nei family DNA glycosylase [Jiangella asiatica]
MPELPDVEGFRRVLDKAAGHRIERVDVLDPGVLRDVSTEVLRDALTDRALATPRRHGKWLIGPVRTGRRHRRAEPSVVFHFGMTGSLSWVTGDDEGHRHDRVVIVTDSGELRYRDLRKLHGIRLPPDDDHLADVLEGLGPDAADLGEDEFGMRLGAIRRRLKPALMDQSVVAGLGNLLADEVLWRARIHPRRRTEDLTDAELDRLHRHLRRVLTRSMRAGRVPGRDTWLTGHRDDRDGICPRCGTSLRRARVGGRSTVWCPNCQPD